MTDKATLEEIEALSAGRTLEPWGYFRHDCKEMSHIESFEVTFGEKYGTAWLQSGGGNDRRDLSKAEAEANAALMAHAPRLLEICREQGARLAEWELFRTQFDGLSYHYEGMGCGIEDRGITDRYQACEHGWDCAMDRVAECIPEEQ